MYDAVIIGGGHNGLVAAAYLAQAGLKVVVLERRHVLGGAAVTEEVPAASDRLGAAGGLAWGWRQLRRGPAMFGLSS
jgi:flavin-dependent dehydrogenase